MDLDLSSLCDLVPEALCSVVYASRYQVHYRFHTIHTDGLGYYSDITPTYTHTHTYTDIQTHTERHTYCMKHTNGPIDWDKGKIIY